MIQISTLSFENAAYKGAKLVSIGGKTSKFFEALDKAGVCEIPITETGEIRNPAYYNPPLVGFRIKHGNGYTYPSILISDTNDIEGLIGALTGC
jgi:hypothetical protein